MTQTTPKRKLIKSPNRDSDFQRFRDFVVSHLNLTRETIFAEKWVKNYIVRKYNGKIYVAIYDAIEKMVKSFTGRKKLSKETLESLSVEDTHPDILLQETMKESLTKREYKTIKQRFWEEKTLKEISNEENIPYERIRQIKQKALEKLKTKLSRKHNQKELTKN